MGGGNNNSYIVRACTKRMYASKDEMDIGTVQYNCESLDNVQMLLKLFGQVENNIVCFTIEPIKEEKHGNQ